MLTEYAQIAASFSLVVVTVGLVMVSYWGYKESKNHTQEMKRSREVEFEPVIKPTVDFYHGPNCWFFLENTGRGAAYDVEAKWSFEHLDYECDWKIALMTSGQRHRFILPFGDLSDNVPKMSKAVLSELEDQDADGVIRFEYTCEDALGRELTGNKTLNVRELLEGRMEGGELQTKDELKEAREALESISSGVADVADSINLEEMSGAAKRGNYEAVIEKVEEETPITLAELRTRTGLSQITLARILSEFKRTGIVDYPDDAELFAQEALDTEIVYKG